MEKWISASAAAKKIGCPIQKIHDAATKYKWQHKLGDPPKHGGRTPRLFRMRDILQLKEIRRHGRAGGSTKSPYYQAVKIVYWADSLTEYPDLSEIEAQMTDKYRIPDIVSVIENRTYRGMPELQRTV